MVPMDKNYGNRTARKPAPLWLGHQSGLFRSGPNYFTDSNGTLFFIANDNTNGKELWKSDGTEAGTTMVKDINRLFLIISTNPLLRS